MNKIAALSITILLTTSTIFGQVRNCALGAEAEVTFHNKKVGKYFIHAEAFNTDLESQELETIFETKLGDDTKYSFSLESSGENVLLKVSKYQHNTLQPIEILIVNKNLKTKKDYKLELWNLMI